MTIGSKRKLLTAMIVSLVICFAMFVGLTSNRTKVNAAINVAEAFETVPGASVRLADNDYGYYGMRFAIRMTSENYQEFVGAGYTDVEFGVAVIPADYKTSKGAFTEANLFGASAIYNLTDETVNGKTKVVNMSDDALAATRTEGGVAYNYLYASITDINANNFARPFVGVGYVKYNDGTGVKYVIEESEARSAAEVATTALADPAAAGYTTEQTDALNAYLTNLAIKIDVTKDGKAMDVAAADSIKTAIKASLATYKVGDMLDITTAVNGVAPLAYAADTENSELAKEIPASGVASFKVDYDFAKTTGNIAPTAKTKGYVSTESTVGYSNVVEENGILRFSAWTNNTNRMIFASSFIKEVYDLGLTNLTVNYDVTAGLPVLNNAGSAINAEAWCDMRISTKKNSTWTTVDHSSDYATKYFKPENALDLSLTWDLSSIMGDLDFAADDTIAFWMPGGTHAPLNMIIESLEFAKPVYTTSGNLITDGNITSVSTYSGTGSTNGPIYSTAFMYGTNYQVWVHTGTAESLKFNSAFVKDCVDKGLTNITMTFYMSNYNSETWSSLKLQHYDASAGTMTTIADAGTIAFRTGDTSTNPRTGTFTLTAETLANIDFAGGDTIAIGNFAAGSNNPLKFVVSSIEFVNPNA